MQQPACAATKHKRLSRHIAQHSICLLLTTMLPAWLRSALMVKEHEVR